MIEKRYDVVIIGSGAGGGAVAAELAPMVSGGVSILVLEQGPRLGDDEFSGNEIEMAPALYEDGGGFLTSDGAMTLAFGRVYGGSTLVYTGVSLIAPERVVRSWNVPGLEFSDIERRSRKYMEQNGARLLDSRAINENNRLFAAGCRALGFPVEQFPVNVRGCRGASVCNLGCPNHAKQGTARVQLPEAERLGVQVVSRAEVLAIAEDRSLRVRVSAVSAGRRGQASEWAAGEYLVRASVIVVAGGSIGSTALLLRSPATRHLRRLGQRLTCHPAQILVAEHDRAIGNDVGHPKSYFLDRAESEGFVLETCMYFPFVTAKSLTGFGVAHSALMRAFPRLQMILVLACDKAIPENRVTIDRKGSPVVHYRFTPRVIESLVAASRMSARIFFAAGARRVHAPLGDTPLLQRSDVARLDRLVRADNFQAGRTSLSAAHLMGGCSMGRDERDSVTDCWGRVHGLPWLYVADSALFPDSVEVNPYITVMALADRTAEAVRADFAALRQAVSLA